MINSLLEKYINNEKGSSFKEYDLSGITHLLQQMGNPHKLFKSVHIAGTNGKGTTSWVLASILEKAGYKTGLYTSPHLVDVNERIRINRIPVTDADFAEIYYSIEKVCSENINIKPTYFDVLTAAAFSYFAERGVDVAVIETGLGGRLDSTNVITPVLSIITDISTDHTEILGNTIRQIACEKAGIIKNRIPVITSNTEESGLDEIRRIADENNSELVLYGKEFSAYNIGMINDRIMFDYRFRETIIAGIEISLFPEHQVKNCSMSLTAAFMLVEMNYIRLSPEFRDLLPGITVPGRYEILSEEPLIIFDPAHNYSGLTNLLNFAESRYGNTGIIAVITLMKDKALPEVIRYFAGRNYPVFYLLSDDQRSYRPENNEFALITQSQDVIINAIETDKHHKAVFFTGTFRNYQAAVRISQTMKKAE